MHSNSTCTFHRNRTNNYMHASSFLTVHKGVYSADFPKRKINKISSSPAYRRLDLSTSLSVTGLNHEVSTPYFRQPTAISTVQSVSRCFLVHWQLFRARVATGSTERGRKKKEGNIFSPRCVLAKPLPPNIEPITSGYFFSSSLPEPTA